MLNLCRKPWRLDSYEIWKLRLLKCSYDIQSSPWRRSIKQRWKLGLNLGIISPPPTPTPPPYSIQRTPPPPPPPLLWSGRKKICRFGSLPEFRLVSRQMPFCGQICESPPPHFRPLDGRLVRGLQVRSLSDQMLSYAVSHPDDSPGPNKKWVMKYY